MASGGKISILIMRDDAGVRRMRLSPFWIQTGLWAVVFLILAAVFFAAGAMYYRGIVAESEHTAQEARRLAADASERLRRLDEIEGVLRAKDLTELQTLLGSYNPDAAAWWKPAVETPASASATPDKAETTAAKIDLRKLLDKVDLNQAGVDNFKSKVENGKLAVSFDLSNLSPQTALAGKAELLILTNDGVLHPLKSEKDELTFQIQRFKQVAVHLALPQGVNPADIYGLRITIADPAGKIIYNSVNPVERP
ncbi:hypothetical protein ASZ90_000560 [hydrocarbon metagenome]|uniref:Uncharacterized protein n=1 Tax=hydrocarbon metagenome TaxID=938273 RepID=A0A0W8GAJ0_9ZZZZ